MIKGRLVFSASGEAYIEISEELQAQWNLSGIALLSSPESVRESHKSSRPKKPENAFFLYKKAKQKEFKERNQRNFNRNMGEMWHNESEEVKEEFRQRAIEVKRAAKANLSGNPVAAAQQAG
ncbi:hypothetical protein BCR44DRAFT_1435508 [Catenaria anguillulae PL171]|uniref:HMG box domain-containing protein n=1 Tax=Catenaria anguillulae PL171 TaxID=765915 RepID=A0A1Y2HMD2_9FUNG|nr:hypothetical protein BCR44DRAFT_1435508 [Catenaria anguillulae PL171]